MISLLSPHRHCRVNHAMATLIVRNLDQSVVDALKRRAARHGRSAEAEHRELLESLLSPRGRKSFAEALAAMPNEGLDEDFERKDDHVEVERGAAVQRKENRRD